MHRRPRMLVALAAVLSLVGAACGSAPEQVVVRESPTPTSEAPVVSPAAVNPETVTVRDLVDEARDLDDLLERNGSCPSDAFGDAQFAFAGTVTAVDVLLNDDKVFEAEELGIDMTDELRSGLMWQWTTFDVEGWYTQDWGSTFRVWMPRLDVTVGDSWLVAGDAHHVVVGDFSGQSGTADPCVSLVSTIDAVGVWAEHFGGSVVPGAAGPESDPAPDIVATIDSAQRQWEASDITDYVVVMAIGDASPPLGECAETRLIRIVVEDGAVVQAVSVSDACEVDVDLIKAPADLYEAARIFSGTDDFQIAFDPDTGFPLGFSGSDRTTAISQFVLRFDLNTDLAVLGWDAVTSSRTLGEELWTVTALNAYDFELDVVCQLCGGTIVGSVRGDEVSFVADGWPNEPLVAGFPPTRIEEQFSFLESYGTVNPVVAVFDSEFGYIRDVWLDQNLGHGQFELHNRVLS